MEINALIGTLAILAALGIITYLTFWSRKAIERIARKKLGSAREIIEDFRNEQ